MGASNVALKPCPFCDSVLVEVPAFSNRSQTYFAHPDNGCVARSINITVSEREADHSRVQGWNRRTGIKPSHGEEDRPPIFVDQGRRLAVATMALFDIVTERRRQIEVEGWSGEHDDAHRAAELARAAACYALSATTPGVPFTLSQSIRTAVAWLWPWAADWFKPSIDPRRDLVKAGALILAEIDRLDRLPAKEEVS